MSLTPRFTAIDKAILVATGNSLVVCGSSTAPKINTSDLVKTDGTITRDWTKAGSTANLNILSNSTILYAELVWYSTVTSNVSGAQNVSSVQDTPISFTTPKGTYSITPTYKDTYEGPTGSIDRYRAADVTTYVKDGLSGSYTVTGVPISVPSTGLSNSRAGWVLSVIYRNSIFKPQMILYDSGISVATNSTPLQITMSGFTTSTNPSLLKGNMFICAANGSPIDGNEYVMAGPSYAQLSNIGNSVYSPNSNPGIAPNNPGNSFFGGIINVADPTSSSNGLINIVGTNATNNNDSFVPTQDIGNRNKWDITDVDISKTLITNQSFLAAQITESLSGDGVQVVALGVQCLAQAPDITAQLELYDIDGDDEYNAEVGEPLVFSVQIKNNGSVSANNVTLSTVLDPSVTFVPNSVTVNTQTIQGADITQGVNIGSVPAYGVSNVTFTIIPKSLPTTPGNLLYDTVNYSYQFTSGPNTITNTANTNTVQVIVQDGLLSISKSSSVATASIKDIVTYTVTIANTGNVNATNILFQDKDSTYSSFVSGSVVIDGNSQILDDPTVGISLADLTPGSSTVISFQSKINSLPPSTIVNNQSCVSFGYIFNQYGYLKEKTIFSNKTSIQVEYVDVIGERCNNNNYPNIGDTVTYTLTLNNVGNQPASNFQIAEPTIPGTTFISGSVKINGVTQSELNPFNGFPLPDPINPQTTTTVTYQVKVTKLNPANTIENIAQVPFKYQITPSSSVISTEKDSNVVDTIANYVCMNIVESVDKAYAMIGDTLYYTANISNDGNINATNTTFLSNIQSGTTFVSGSVIINGVSYSTYDPNQGFTLGTICASDIIEVKYQAKVNSVPNPNIVYNQSDLVYSYQPDPSNSSLTGSVNSNTVQTIINQAAYTITKSVNKQYAQLGEPLVYTINIQNTGTVPLTDVLFADYIGIWMNLYMGTVYINGVNYPTYDPSKSFSLGDIHPGDTVTVVFATTVVVNPPVGYIPNTAEAIINYQVNPTSPKVTKTIYSNTVVTYDPSGSLALSKSVDKAYAIVGDTLTYSFTVTNNGTAIISDAIFTDTLQKEATFVAGSVIVNGSNIQDYDPTVGFSLGTMYVGQTITVSFQVTVNKLPSPNTIKNSATTSYSYYVDPTQQPITKNITSNTVTTTINAYSATITKAVDKSYAMVGNILTYTITANNTGTVPLTNVNFVDIVGNGATFVPGSVTVNGASTGYSTANPNNGFTIPNISAGGSSVVTFQATVTSVPTPPQINNTASMTFQYKLNPTSGQYISGSLTSNTVTTNIIAMAVTNTKSVDKTYATYEDIITYTSVITNNGNESITNTTFLDVIPSSTTFVIGSVYIGATQQQTYDPSKGFTLGTIAAGASVTVKFQVKVTSVPGSGYITNTSNINYQYTVGTSTISSNTTSNSVTTYINYGTMTVVKSVDRTIVKLNNKIIYTVVISNTGNTVLKNLLFKDTIQSESSFDTGTVYVNGTNVSDANPNTGFSLSDIHVGQQTTVSFEVTANSIPANNELFNTATVNYSYYVDPNGTPISSSVTSQPTTVYVYDTIMSANKVVDKSIAKIGDTINFTITVKNDGNVSATNVKFKDILDSNIHFVQNSVYIGTNQQTGYDPNTGFSLPDITSGSTVTVKFQATVQTRPTGNIIYNYATITYDYTSDKPYTGINMNTNTTQTYVAVGELTLTKSVNKTYATKPDTLTYTVVVANTGSVDATSLKFTDLAPASTVFNTGSVVVDGSPQASYDPTVGFNLDDLTPNQYHTVTFSVNVTSIPVSGEVDNTASTKFTYQLPSETAQTITATSNMVKTYIKLGMLTLTKSVDKLYATIGDILNYTIIINNTGNANCTSILFKDIIQSNAKLVSGSVIVNGSNVQGVDPSVGFSIPDIAGYGSSTVKFQVTVQSLPSNYIIYNTATANYGYYINPSNPLVTTQATSNTVATVINVGSLSVTKAVNKAYATLGDTLVYTVTVVNTGNVIANTVNFRDVIPNGLTFVPNSVSINGTVYPGYDPYASFTLDNINPGASVVVSFNTTVTSLPNPSLISNTANITFAYLINPSGSYVYAQVNSNTVTTQINVGAITLTKTVDKAYVTMGDVLTYTVVVANTGNINNYNVEFLDNLQSDITFNSGTVKIDGVTYTGYDPTVGFNLGTIATLKSVTVQFKVTVINSPTHDSVINYASGTFSYYVDPNGTPYSMTTQSNTVSTVIVQPSITLAKTVDKIYATLNDKLNYGILVKNTGNTPISNILFTDFLSNGATFVGGTVVIDGVNYINYDPVTGFTLPNSLVAGNTSLVQFQVAVNSTLPTPATIINYSTSSGQYYIGTSQQSISATSNTVTTNIKLGQITNTKTVDKMYAKVGDTILYTSTIINSGNVTASNVQFLDTLQSSLSFVAQTVAINGVTYPTLDPTVGFSLSNLTPGQTVTVTFSAKINTLPTQAYVNNTSQVQFSYYVDPYGVPITYTQNSNTVTTNVVLGKLNVTKIVDKAIATVGDILTYTVTLTNVGNVIDNNVTFQDTPTTGVTFNTGSVTVNGVGNTTADPTKGFSLGNIGIGSVVIVVFTVTVTSVPSTNQVLNQAVIPFQYVVDPKQSPYSDTAYSNTVTTNIAYGSLSVTKAVDKKFATIGDLITYTVTVVNNGNINATNVVFLDPTPANSVFVIGSVTVNGTPYSNYNPSAGFNLNTMTPGQIITVVYKVQVVNLC